VEALVAVSSTWLSMEMLVETAYTTHTVAAEAEQLEETFLLVAPAAELLGMQNTFHGCTYFAPEAWNPRIEMYIEVRCSGQAALVVGQHVDPVHLPDTIYPSSHSPFQRFRQEQDTKDHRLLTNALQRLIPLPASPKGLLAPSLSQTHPPPVQE